MKDETYTLARFWSKVDVRRPHQCWLWTARCFRYGYGNFYVRKGVTTGAHRFSWEIENGPVPTGLRVLHACDNPPCVNPAHLFVGTQLDNVADMIAKGRRPRGAHEGLRNGRALITPDDVREIRRRYAAGEFQSSIARDFPIGKTQVAAIASRKSWWCVE